jgi:plasmid stabilization system protein ParE
MKFKLRILRRAERDVQQIYNYIGARSSAGAQRWWIAFHEASRRVTSSPHAYPVAAEQLISSFELRQFCSKLGGAGHIAGCLPL